MAEAKPAALAVRIVGRIEQVRSINSQSGRAFMHLVKLPAADEYSSPATVEVKGAERVGQEGDKFDRMCAVGGYGRTYQVTDEETGRKVTRRTADNTLTVVG